MADLAHQWGRDLELSATGDLALADGELLTQQALLRRLMTNLGDYLPHLDYGAGLPGFLGEPTHAMTLQAVVREQVALEPTVAASPEPVVEVSADRLGLVLVRIVYTSAETGGTETLTFNL